MSATERLRLLFVAPFPPRLAGTHGGAKVVGQLLLHTAERHEVGLVHLRYPGEPDVDEELRGRLAVHEPVARPADDRRDPAHWVRALRWRAGLVGGRPRLVSELSSPAAAARVRATVATWRPDVVRLEYPAAGAYAGAIDDRRAARLLADYDASLETARRAQTALERLEHRLDLRAWRRFRRRLLREVDAAVVPTEHDRRTLSALADATEIVAIPFGADVDAPALDAAGRDDASLLFVGNFNHVPNVDAAEFLVREVLPRVRRDHPGVLLRLVGERPPDLAGAVGVEALGRVEDVAPFLDAASVVVAPLRTGGGMRVKVVESLVAGKAVVASRRGVEGIALEPGRHAVVADGADAFAAEVSALLADRGRRIELGTSAREWAVGHLGWRRSLDAYDALYERIVARRRASPGPAESDHRGVA